MRALILNSGMGRRMGALTKSAPKCFSEIEPGKTILDFQMEKLLLCGVDRAVITTGPFHDKIEARVRDRYPDMRATFVHNLAYAGTNYIYSIYLAREELADDLVLMHGDLVFETGVLLDLLHTPRSTVAVDRSLALPDKDFKAVCEGDRVRAIGVDLFENACALQPLYHLYERDWRIWLEEIAAFCARGETDVYAENALNRVSGEMELYAFDVAGRLCAEIDNPADLEAIRAVRAKLK